MEEPQRYSRNGKPLAERLVAPTGDGLGVNGPPPEKAVRIIEGFNGKPAAPAAKPVVSPPPPPKKK